MPRPKGRIETWTPVSGGGDPRSYCQGTCTRQGRAREQFIVHSPLTYNVKFQLRPLSNYLHVQCHPNQLYTWLKPNKAVVNHRAGEDACRRLERTPPTHQQTPPLIPSSFHFPPQIPTGTQEAKSENARRRRLHEPLQRRRPIPVRRDSLHERLRNEIPALRTGMRVIPRV
jgi:hypothetical protein